ncbi:MAG: AraC family transcriptional regulator [Terrimicrobiaceae bacterium]
MIWEMKMDPQRILAASSAPSNDIFGSVILSGEVRGSLGVSFEKMRILGSYALVFLTGGCGHYQRQGFPPVSCRKGDLLVIFPEIPHAYGPGPGEFWNEVYVVFQGSVFDLWRRHGLLDPENAVIRMSGPQAFRKTLREMRGILRAADNTSSGTLIPLDAVCRLQSLLGMAVREGVSKGQDRKAPVWAEAAMEYLAARPDASLEDAARLAGLSYESFRKKFRAVCGMSPAAWRDRQAMQLACKWIYEERLPNKQIAARLGYCDEFHFSRRFHQITGQTPRSVRDAFFGKTGVHKD